MQINNWSSVLFHHSASASCGMYGKLYLASAYHVCLGMLRHIQHFAMTSAECNLQDYAKPSHNGSFQAYSTGRPSNSIIVNAHMNDLACLSPVASPVPEQRMGSLTGWQAIAAQATPILLHILPCLPLQHSSLLAMMHMSCCARHHPG